MCIYYIYISQANQLELIIHIYMYICQANQLKLLLKRVQFDEMRFDTYPCETTTTIKFKNISMTLKCSLIFPFTVNPLPYP